MQYPHLYEAIVGLIAIYNFFYLLRSLYTNSLILYPPIPPPPLPHTLSNI